MRERYPGVPVVTYVNTSAEVKAESDITCTSSNAVAVVESLGVDRVIFTPDQYLGSWVATQTDVEVILWEGACMVHERFTGAEIAGYKAEMGDIPVIAHPESPPDVLAEADYVGSTHGMINWVTRQQPEKVMMITECSMADNVAESTPNTTYVRPCNLCPHMKRITLPKIRRALETMTHAVEIDPAVPMTARDGTTLMSFVGRPVGEGPFGVVMERTPYLRIDTANAVFWASRGYIYVKQDLRGRGGSGGVRQASWPATPSSESRR